MKPIALSGALTRQRSSVLDDWCDSHLERRRQPRHGAQRQCGHMTGTPNGMMVLDRMGAGPDRKPPKLKIVCRECGEDYAVKSRTLTPFLPLPSELFCADCDRKLEPIAAVRPISSARIRPQAGQTGRKPEFRSDPAQ